MNSKHFTVCRAIISHSLKDEINAVGVGWLIVTYNAHVS